MPSCVLSFPPAVRRVILSAALIFLPVLRPNLAMAQPAEDAGVRAQGMGGAFTAVADDASATWWNPAGLGAWNSSGKGGGTYANATLEYGTHQAPRSDHDAGGLAVPAARAGVRGFSIGYPALGLSYYRIRISEMQPFAPTGTAGAGRQDPGTADVRLRSLVVNQFGSTVAQSLGRHLVLGSTVKLLLGSVGVTSSPSSAASLDAAAGLGGDGETHLGLDVGAMASFGLVRVGLMVRNVRETTFGSGTDAVTLDRQVRGGLAFLSGARGGPGRFSAAIDADLTTATTPVGEERRVAAGAEAWLLRRTLGVRGGASASTVGSRRTSVSGGLSAAVARGTYVDAEVTGGGDDVRRGWGLALRLTF